MRRKGHNNTVKVENLINGLQKKRTIQISRVSLLKKNGKFIWNNCMIYQ